MGQLNIRPLASFWSYDLSSSITRASPSVPPVSLLSVCWFDLCFVLQARPCHHQSLTGGNRPSHCGDGLPSLSSGPLGLWDFGSYSKWSTCESFRSSEPQVLVKQPWEAAAFNRWLELEQFLEWQLYRFPGDVSLGEVLSEPLSWCVYLRVVTRISCSRNDERAIAQYVCFLCLWLELATMDHWAGWLIY